MDRVQEFEHITIQLEGENSTIVEYIDLYHKRRKDLKEKFMEKDAFITKLLQEREELKVVTEDVCHCWYSHTHCLNNAVEYVRMYSLLNTLPT
jgi:hypothetical protein